MSNLIDKNKDQFQVTFNLPVIGKRFKTEKAQAFEVAQRLENLAGEIRAVEAVTFSGGENIEILDEDGDTVGESIIIKGIPKTKKIDWDFMRKHHKAVVIKEMIDAGFKRKDFSVSTGTRWTPSHRYMWLNIDLKDNPDEFEIDDIYEWHAARIDAANILNARDNNFSVEMFNDEYEGKTHRVILSVNYYCNVTNR